MRRVTVVLDDDPTGTQEVTAVPVLLRRNRDALRDLLARHDAVFVLTNTRALAEVDAVALIGELYEDIRGIESELGVDALVVQRGDSTMRGHVFAELDAAGDRGIAVFCPAFPAGGRRTLEGVHEVRVAGIWMNAADTEFAADPVFGYAARTQLDYVGEKGRGWVGVTTQLDTFAAALAQATPGTVLLPNVETDDDIRRLAELIENAVADGTPIAVRSAAPLAAYLAHAKSAGFVSPADARSVAAHPSGGLLVVVGSHTAASGSQLAALLQARRRQVHQLPTDHALDDPIQAGRMLAIAARDDLRSGFAIITSERTRRAEHSTLEHAEAVMGALVEATRVLAADIRAVVTKGGITSAEIARSGLDRGTAWVAGQLVAGVSLWVLPAADEARSVPGILYGVVPGNIGEADTLREVVDLVDAASRAAP